MLVGVGVGRGCWVFFITAVFSQNSSLVEEATKVKAESDKVCVCACMVRACVRVCAHARVRVCVCVYIRTYLCIHALMEVPVLSA